jgi:DNA topoisomerase-3
VRLAEPHEVDPDWKRWRREAAADATRNAGRCSSATSTRDQFEVVRAAFSTTTPFERIVCATDAGREGELIFRYLYEASGCRKPFSRLWISSLTPDAIRQGFQKLRDGREFDPLAAAARGRSQADWLVGMNLSRAYTLACGTFTVNETCFSVGRVQTPTLAMVVERDLAIRAFVPEDYREVVATLRQPPLSLPSPLGRGVGGEGSYGLGGEPEPKRCRLPSAIGASGFAANARNPRPSACPPMARKPPASSARARRGRAVVESRAAETRRAPPPLLYDLTELQRHANRLYGFSAQMTLDIAQKLYEQHKLISYPRTDSRHLSSRWRARWERWSAAIAGTLSRSTGAGQPASDRWGRASWTTAR